MSAPLQVAVLGVTGFIGRGLPALLTQAGFAVTGVSRSGGNLPGVQRWQTPDTLDFAAHHAVINLAGESVARRWTAANRARFHESRVSLTNKVVAAIRALPADSRPSVLINTSAVGIYGDREDEVLTESSTTGHDYLAELCRDWEAAAMAAEPLGTRVVRPRIGIVLGRGGEATEKLMRVFKAGIGGRLGSGRQWMPWIHVHDVRAAFVHALLHADLGGAVNCSAPSPERNADFTRKLAAALHRPALLPVPGFALKLAFGGFGSALLSGQNTRPTALLQSGFTFRFPTLESALADLTDS